jgi:membrane protein
MGATVRRGFDGSFQNAWQVIKTAAADWSEDKAAQMGAALAFYSVLSLAPLVVISLSIAALFVDVKMAASQFLTQMQSLVGAEGAKAIEGMLQHAQQPKTGAIAAILGVITLLLGASGVFGQLQDAMNSIWDVPPKAQAGIWNTIRSRFLSFGMVLGTGFLLLVSLLLSTIIAGVGEQFGHWWPALEPVTHVADEAVTFLVMTLLFAMMFKLLPDAPVAWRDVWLGAFLTSILITIGKLVIGLYLGKAAVGNAYGAAGSLVVLLVWIYYSAQILFFGAEMTHVLGGAQQSQKTDIVNPAVGFSFHEL